MLPVSSWRTFLERQSDNEEWRVTPAVSKFEQQNNPLRVCADISDRIIDQKNQYSRFAARIVTLALSAFSIGRTEPI